MLKKGSLFSRFINKYWVTSNYVPLQPVAELQIDLNRPIIYVIEQNSASDLLGLQASCIKAGLPDPYLPIQVDGQEVSATIYIHRRSWFSYKEPHVSQVPYLSQYQKLLALHKANPQLDIQLVPVSFYWGRNPGKQGKTSKFDLVDQRLVGIFHKSLIVVKNAKDHLVRFNNPISIASLTKRCKQKQDYSDEQLAHTLAKIAMSYFEDQKRTSIGPKLPNRNEMIDAVLQQESLKKVIIETAKKEKISEHQVEQQCRAYLQEIGANFSYPLLRVFRIILRWVWNHIYKGIEVNHAQAVRQANQSGAEIIYMPCHRSHMDYLLLSYLLFEQGLVPPHVAAGVNLNFFPAGPIFRRSGGFFLRRTFKDSPLYADVFKAYFSMLFQKGYPIEFFTEGGRSRTGRLLPAKVGLLATSLQTYIDQPERNIIIVPVYIGYDHIMEV
ncbi:MAG: 1-acyl-sn-glycerol-3-phosphate acyltransferase, partial [Legionella sp.]|nr:1-acyl-sn-glycerol-3-phosphate acyltransferase [Legionella sp.]